MCHHDLLNDSTFGCRCQNANGGYGGGPLQYSHLAPTYASINALIILGAYDSIDR